MWRGRGRGSEKKPDGSGRFVESSDSQHEQGCIVTKVTVTEGRHLLHDGPLPVEGARIAAASSLEHPFFPEFFQPRILSLSNAVRRKQQLVAAVELNTKVLIDPVWQSPEHSST